MKFMKKMEKKERSLNISFDCNIPFRYDVGGESDK